MYTTYYQAGWDDNYSVVKLLQKTSVASLIDWGKGYHIQQNHTEFQSYFTEFTEPLKFQQCAHLVT